MDRIISISLSVWKEFLMHTPVCSKTIKHVDDITVHVVPMKHVFKICYSEANASELVENVEGMFPHY